MKFGIFLPLQSPRPWHSGSDTRLIAEAIEQAELADRLGFDYVWVQEHHFLEEYSHSSAPEVLLGAISQRTRDIRLGHGVMLMSPGYNHPARSAERIAMLDQVSGGRVEWGTGASGTRVELEGFGLDPAVKYAQWEEGVRTAVRLLTETPFTGTSGEYVNMPARNLVPKPAQAPHPPLWLACSNRENVRNAARLGVGALTFAFVNAEEAKFWVDAYYSSFEAGCQPLGRAVNPNLAMLSNFVCHRDRDAALRQGLAGAEFFAYGLGHYFRFGRHTPGRTDLWQAAQAEADRPFVNRDRFNTPDGLREHYRTLEDAGVDQVILLQQAGGYAHEDVCASLELFAAHVLPEFKARDRERSAAKAQRLAAAIARAEAAIPPLPAADPIEVIEAYGSESGRPPMMNSPLPNAASAPAPRAAAPGVPESLAACFTMADVVRFRAAERPRHRALIELADDGTLARSVTYAELAAAMERTARHVAGRIQPSDRVLVVGDSGIGLAVAMLAVTRAGGTIVPAPRPLADQRTDRVELLLDAACPSLVLGDAESLAALAARRPDARPLLLSFEDASTEGAGDALPLRAAELALIQYTSGATQRPKGVPITHAMVLRSMANTNALFGFTSTDRFLAVLPLYHTFGLMVHNWSALWAGSACYLLAPLAFAADPGVWLRAVTEHAITVSGAPNFAFARCAELASTHDEAVDLSSWRLALSGGEPPQADVIEKFVARWRPRGLVRGAVTPSYGLTEGTGTVTGQSSLVGPRVLQVDGQRLATGTVVPAPDGRTLVSNGRFVAGAHASIVDPATRSVCAPGVIGELWLRGETIASQYVGDAGAPERFAELSDRPGERYLRTGDLGCVIDGELYLTGRAHDLIIVRGENVFPDDIELIARQVAPFIPPSGVAALGVPTDGSEALALVVEVPDGTVGLAASLDAIRSALARRLGVRVAQLVCVRAGSLPKTPIGKLKRGEARRMLMEGALASLEVASASPGPEPSIEQQLERIWCEALKRPRVERDQTLFELGGDSLLAANTLARINERFGTKLTLTQTVARFTIDAIAKQLREVRPPEPMRVERAEVARFDEFSVQVLRTEHVPEAIECLVEAFQRLPLVQALAPSRAEFTQFIRVVTEDAAQHGLSLVLLHRPSGRVVGCGICEDYVAALSGEIPDFLDRLLPGITIQVALDEKYLASAGVPTDKTFHMNLLALDRELEGRNLPVRFTQATLDFAVERGFSAAIVHAASPVVQAMMRENFGFVCVAAQEYATYELNGVRTCPNLPPGDSIMLMTRSLRDFQRGPRLPLEAAPVSVAPPASDNGITHA